MGMNFCWRQQFRGPPEMVFFELPPIAGGEIRRRVSSGELSLLNCPVRKLPYLPYLKSGNVRQVLHRCAVPPPLFLRGGGGTAAGFSWGKSGTAKSCVFLPHLDEFFHLPVFVLPLDHDQRACSRATP